MLVVFAVACIMSSDYTTTQLDKIGCNKKYYVNDAVSLCKLLQHFYFIAAFILFYFKCADGMSLGK